MGRCDVLAVRRGPGEDVDGEKRGGAVTKKTYQLSVGDKAYRVDVEAFDGKRARVKVDGKPYEVEVKEPEAPVKGSADAAATPGPISPTSCSTSRSSPTFTEP